MLLRFPGCRGGGSGSGAKARIWRPGKGSVPGARSQGQKVRSTKAGGGGGRVRTGWGWGRSHSVTSSPSLRRACKQRAYFDGSQHTPLLPGPSAQRFRAGLLERGGAGGGGALIVGACRPARPPRPCLSTPPHDLSVFKVPLSDLSPLHLFVRVLTELGGNLPLSRWAHIIYRPWVVWIAWT